MSFSLKKSKAYGLAKPPKTDRTLADWESPKKSKKLLDAIAKAEKLKKGSNYGQ